ncbi:MAG: GIY-YIG nuclease family protein [Ignavibacteriae bacterium]|nr:GIY-YIG nuclease family protein [Ignavibacteriota bacterium]MCB9243490.1 GIY-YIG nuclease family protein [Ignavibacteriales bacterium]
MPRNYYIYILANKTHSVLYTGVTNNLIARVLQHKEQKTEGFTKRYKVTKLVYYESTTDVSQAITREKQIKGGSRQKKIELVKSLNPEWKDLSNDFI